MQYQFPITAQHPGLFVGYVPCRALCAIRLLFAVPFSVLLQVSISKFPELLEEVQKWDAFPLLASFHFVPIIWKRVV